MMVAQLLALAQDQRNTLRVHRRFLSNCTDPLYLPEARFTELFRLNKESALELLHEINPYMKDGVRITFIPKVIKMVATSHYYATESYLRDIGQDFVGPIS